MVRADERTRHGGRRREARHDARSLVIAWKELLQLRRDRPTLAMMAGAAGDAAHAVRLRDQHRRPPHPDRWSTTRTTAPSRATSCARLEATRLLRRASATSRSYDEIQRALRSGQARVALVIPPRFASRPARAGGRPRVQLVVDGSDPQTVASATNTAAALVAARSGELVLARLRTTARRRADTPISARAGDLVQPRSAHGGLRRARPGRRDPDDDDGHAHRDGDRARARARHARAADRLAGRAASSSSSARSCRTWRSATCR